MKQINLILILLITVLFTIGCTQKQEAYIPTQTIIKALKR